MRRLLAASIMTAPLPAAAALRLGFRRRRSTMRAFIAGAIGALLPALAGAQTAGISIDIQNCAPVDVAVAPLVPSDPRYLGSNSVARGETRSVWCPVGAGCWLQISYRTSPTYQLGTYQHAYTTDRCTRGTQDIAAGDLPAIGNCGC